MPAAVTTHEEHGKENGLQTCSKNKNNKKTYSGGRPVHGGEQICVGECVQTMSRRAVNDVLGVDKGRLW